MPRVRMTTLAMPAYAQLSDADAAALREVIEVGMYSADRIETEFSGTDAY